MYVENRRFVYRAAAVLGLGIASLGVASLAEALSAHTSYAQSHPDVAADRDTNARRLLAVDIVMGMLGTGFVFSTIPDESLAESAEPQTTAEMPVGERA